MLKLQQDWSHRSAAISFSKPAYLRARRAAVRVETSNFERVVAQHTISAEKWGFWMSAPSRTSFGRDSEPPPPLRNESASPQRICGDATTAARRRMIP